MEILKHMRPKYDIGTRRMVYLTEMANGKIAYLPLENSASDWEKARGLYAALVPLEPLDVFLARDDIVDDIAPRTFDPDEGEVRAYALVDIKKAFEKAQTLVLRSAQFVSNVAREIPELQQQLSDV